MIGVGLVCSNPELLAKLLALFICPDLHKHSLLGSIQTPKQSKKNAMLSSAVVKQRTKMMLSHHTDVYPTCASDVVVNMLLSMMEGLNFMMPLTTEESESFLIPSLRPVTEFRWNYLPKDRENDILTFGRRIKLRDSQYVHPAWFCSIQVCGILLCLCMLIHVIKFYTGQAYTTFL